MMRIPNKIKGCENDRHEKHDTYCFDAHGGQERRMFVR
jgi:hypothetical protein